MFAKYWYESTMNSLEINGLENKHRANFQKLDYLIGSSTCPVSPVESHAPKRVGVGNQGSIQE